MVWFPCSPRDSQKSSTTPEFKSINSSVLSFPNGPTLKSIHSVQFSHSVMCDSLWLHEPQHARTPCPSPTTTLHKLISIESVMSSNHLILCRPLLLPPLIFPSIRVFPRSQVFASGGQSIGVSASSSILLMNIQDWFPLGWTGWISLQVQGTLKSLLQHHSSKASILWC